MAPSAQAPDARAAPRCLAVLDEIAQRWREGLALVQAGEPAKAQLAVEAAGEMLARLGELEQLRSDLDPDQLAAFADRMSRLSALHHELSVQSRRAQEEVVRALGSTRHGRATLKAYRVRSPANHACDEVG